jgi:hypothetical protein
MKHAADGNAAPAPASGRSRRSRIASAALLACAIAAQGCAPVVMHSPRVERGLGIILTGGASLQPCMDDGTPEKAHCPRGLNPLVGLGGSYGWMPKDSTRPSYSATLMLPVFDPGGPAVDVYAQAPRGARPERARGAGLMFSPRYVMPYVQAGRIPEKRSGWYTTQGIVVTAYAPEERLDENAPPETLNQGVYAVYWAPTLTYVRHDRGGIAHLYASAALGRYRPREGVAGDSTGAYTLLPARTMAALRLGVTAEVRHLRDLVPAGRRRPNPCPHGQFCPP